MDNWQQTIQDIKDVLYGMWVENKITKTEYQKLFMSMQFGIKGSDFKNAHFPLTFSQRLDTKEYFGNFPK